eukprot:6033026-Alexandrium_andersonii.AAC.1
MSASLVGSEMCIRDSRKGAGPTWFLWSDEDRVPKAALKTDIAEMFKHLKDNRNACGSCASLDSEASATAP